MMKTIFVLYFVSCGLKLERFVLGITNEDALHRTANIDGDFIIGALFPIHGSLSSNIDRDDPLKCDSMRGQLGIQFVEAAFFAIDAINRDEHLLPGIKLGIIIKDECWNDQVAMYQTMQLIQKSTAQPSNPLLGIIGASTQTSTNQVKSLTKLYQVPQINYAASLLDLQISKYFLSVVPNRNQEIPAILNILLKFGWDYVSFIYGDDLNPYTENDLFFFQEWANKLEICLSTRIFVPPRSQNFYDDSIYELFQDERAKVIVCFCEEPTITAVYKEIHERNLTGNYLLLISNNWYTDSAIFQGYQKEARGSMIVEKGSTYWPEFDDYFLRLNLQNKRNPWFDEFWQYQFQCSVTDENSDLPACTGKEDLMVNYEQRPEVSYIIKSIYTLAHGLDKMRADTCKTQTGTCPELLTFNTTKYMDYLHDLNFVFHDDFIYFDSIGFPLTGRYDIFSYQKLSNGSYDKVKISEYKFGVNSSKNDMEFSPSSNHITPTNSIGDGKSSFKSSCSDPCLPGFAKRRGNGNSGKGCCWSCEPCQRREILIDETTCQQCPMGYWPNSDSTNCLPVPTIYSGLTKWQLLVARILSSVCIMLTLFTTYVFLQYRNTPVVKSSTPELCYVILIGVFLQQSISFITSFQPSLSSCIFIETMPSLSNTIIYVSLLVKTNRIARLLAISNNKFPDPHPKFMSLRAQLIITFFLIVIVVIVGIVFTIYTPPQVQQTVDVIENNVYTNVECIFSGNIFYFCTVYKTVLIILGTYYAIRCRNIPENFNETKYIAFLMYVICISTVAHALVHFGSNYKMLGRSIHASVNGLAALVLLFLPKIYVILWMPEKNTRQYFTTTTGIRFAFGRSDNECITRKDAKNDIKIIENVSRHQQKIFINK